MKFLVCGIFLSLLVSAAFGQETHLYAVDTGPNRQAPWQVIRYDAQGENPVVFITTELAEPQDILFLEQEGTVLVSNLQSGRITKYDATTGTYIGDFATGIGGPTRMEFGPGNLIYVLQWSGNGRVLRYERDGTYVGEFTTVGVSNSIGLDWDAVGNLYVASYNSGRVRKFDSNGNDLGLFISANLSGPTNIWFAANGELIVMDWNVGIIKRFDSSGVFQGNLITGLSEPEGVEFLPNGDFLVANGGTSSVKQYQANGSFVKDFVAAGSGGLVKPNAIRFRTTSALEINSGMNDAWYNPATAGQGVFITVYPDLNAMFLAMFTYDLERPPANVSAVLGEPGHRWFTAFGHYTGNSAVLDVELTQGGIFDAGAPQPVQTPHYGTVRVVFTDCNNLTLSYEIPSLGLSGQVPMTRLTLDNVALCELLGGGG